MVRTEPGTAFADRHIGPGAAEQKAMLEALGYASPDALIDAVVPPELRMRDALSLAPALGETAALEMLRSIARRNQPWRTWIGMGYHGCFTPAVIQRNVIENPGWYTAYTPYQAEISQGRLEALLNFQQMVMDLTGLPIANASLLDEASAAAEAMTLIRRSTGHPAQAFFVDAACHPQVIAVIRTRAKWLGIRLVVGDAFRDLDPAAVFGIHLQYPDTFGRLRDPRPVIESVHAAKGLVSVGCDLLALLLVKSPGELGADVALGSAQRFGVPMGFGGPHAAFMATRDEFKRALPGRIIGVSRDAAGRVAYRMALQTREQHIRREKATSNICTAQALLANVAAFYAVYHGPEGLARIATHANAMARRLAGAVEVESQAFFDTLTCRPTDPEAARRRAAEARVNLRFLPDGRVGVAFDETTTEDDVERVAAILGGKGPSRDEASIPAPLRRADPVLRHPVFHRYRTETEMMRYLKRLENEDLSLVHSMIPLGSCTMKLNAAAELAPISWPELADVHPFVPRDQAAGLLDMAAGLEQALAAITGFASVSFQPNSGAQGEYAGLLTIRNYHAARGEDSRDVCLIPASAHGTNPASAALIGLKVVVVGCDGQGNVDVEDLKRKTQAHAGRIAALMLTYPSTHGVFETRVKEICAIAHQAGAQVYMDGANLNALAGLARPADLGADVCHINLHKTFCIPHGGGGPGMGPIAVAAHLAPHLPGHAAYSQALEKNGSVAASPFGSALILAISWMYIRMMGAEGIKRATVAAILNANYVAHRLAAHYPVLYTGASGRVAHECILDLRPLKAAAEVTAEDVAKRLADYGFHAPTVSFPVAGTLMVEPTESESKAELDRFCDSMIAIREEIARVQSGAWPRSDNPLKNAPHTAEEIAGEWSHPYSRETAVYPSAAQRAWKYWPPVKRVDNAAGDRELVCGCPPIESYA